MAALKKICNTCSGVFTSDKLHSFRSTSLLKKDDIASVSREFKQFFQYAFSTDYLRVNASGFCTIHILETLKETIQRSLNYFCFNFSFFPSPKNIRKPLVFWCFQGIG